MSRKRSLSTDRGVSAPDTGGVSARVLGDDPAAFEETELIIAKQRKGPTGTVKLGFVPQFARFEQG